MRGVQPSRLTDQELEGQIYLRLGAPLDIEWAKELLARFTRMLDDPLVASRHARSEGYQKGFDDGYAQGLEAAKYNPPV